MILPRRAWVALFAMSCGCEAGDIDWQIRVGDPAVAEQVALVEATVRADVCDGDVRYRALVRRDEDAPAPRSLGEGRFAFVGEARDDACNVIARGCATAELPRDDDDAIVVVLDAVEVAPACAADTCERGVCGDPASSDGGVDPIPDADPSDAQPPDAEPDAPPACAGTILANQCYTFSATARGYTDAESACGLDDGHLVSIADEAERAVVRDLAGSATIWIGLNDVVRDDAYVWTDGSGSSYRRWASGEPSSLPLVDEDCVSDASDGYRTESCLLSHPFVCERAL